MGKKFTALMLALALCLTFAVPAATAGTATSKVKLPASWTALNVRAGAGTNYPVVTWVADGDKIDIVQEGASWSKIKVVKNGKTGYIKNAYIENHSGGTPTDPGTIGTATAGSVSGNGVNLRTGPGTSYDKIVSLSKGAKVKIWSESGNWYYVTTSGNAKGWMSKNYISEGFAMTTTANVNFRKSANGTVIETLSKGTNVTVLSITGSWSKVKVGSTTGYVYNQYLK